MSNNLSTIFSRLFGLRKSLDNYFEIQDYRSMSKTYATKKLYPNEAKEYFEIYNNLIKKLKEELPDLYSDFKERAIDRDPGRGDWITYESFAIIRMDLENIFEIKNSNESLLHRSLNHKELAEQQLERLFDNFHKVAQEIRDRHADRETVVIKDEYDVQDLVRSLLKLYFEDVRPEEYSPSSSGSNSRIDFLLKKEKIGIEIKMTNEKLKERHLGEQILIDIGRYIEHPDCNCLYVFIYDKLDFVRNKQGLIRDLESKTTEEFKIRVIITPS